MTKEELNPPSPGTDISPVHSEIPEDDDVEKLRKDFVYNLQEEIERMYIQPYTYEKVRYETENVKQLRKAKVIFCNNLFSFHLFNTEINNPLL